METLSHVMYNVCIMNGSHLPLRSVFTTEVGFNWNTFSPYPFQTANVIISGSLVTMLDLFTIFTKGGIVLWYFQGTALSLTPAVNSLIKSVILQVRPLFQLVVGIK